MDPCEHVLETDEGGPCRVAHTPGEATSPPAAEVDFSPALAVADAVLYEGYLLYPYRRSSAKNRIRWQFGVLAPRRWAEAHGEETTGPTGAAESWWTQTECLLEAGADARVEVLVRYLQLQPPTTGGERQPPTTGGDYEEATTRRHAVSFCLGEVAASPLDTVIVEEADGEHALRGRLHVGAELLSVPFPLWKLTMAMENTGELDAGTPRPEALRHSFVSTHLLAGVGAGSFLSLLDPPEWARPAAASCRNLRSFPVLAGPPGRHDLVLSSPIILYDHPQIAPESPGDLFDSAEIDEILSLRTLTLAEEEKAEVRATDPRARELLERVEAMPDEVFARLHGAVRSLRPVVPGPVVPGPVVPGPVVPGPVVPGPVVPGPVVPGPVVHSTRGSPTERLSPLDAQRPAVEAGNPTQAPRPGPRPELLVSGRPVVAGTRVRLRPRGRGADAQDMFLAGRAATVLELLDDVDGSRFAAVCLDGDPRAALGTGPGRLYHFAPEELELLETLEEPEPDGQDVR